MKPLVPDDFEVPDGLKGRRFRLRMLTVHDVVRDYDAVMSSIDHLQKVWNTEWPRGLTLEQNLIDLGWHQKEFQRRRSFAYTVVAPDESRVLGCVYIYPTHKKGYDAEIYYWTRQSELESGLEEEVGDAVRAWLTERWPFANAAFPGRDMSLSAWQEIDEAAR